MSPSADLTPSPRPATSHTRAFFGSGQYPATVQRLQRELNRAYACVRRRPSSPSISVQQPRSPRCHPLHRLYEPAAQVAEYDEQQCRFVVRRNAQGLLQYTRQERTATGELQPEEVLLDMSLVSHSHEPMCVVQHRH